MRRLLLIFSLLFSIQVLGQKTVDTLFVVRNFSCQCNYIVEGKPDIKPFDLHEKSAAYPGGDAEWKKFLKKNLDKGYKGKDKVELKFTVNAGGDLSDFTILNHAPAQKFSEIVRVLKLSGKWFPAVRDGYCVAGDVTISAEL